MQVYKYRELMLQNRRRAADRLFWIDRAVSFEVDNKLVEIGALLYTSRVN